MIADFWHDFVVRNDLLERKIEIGEDHDLSELGIDLKTMTFEQAISEATEAHPEIESFKSGCFSVGMCLVGSGDYYYIDTVRGKCSPLYGIYHDSVVADEIARDGIEKVLESYAERLD